MRSLLLFMRLSAFLMVGWASDLGAGTGRVDGAIHYDDAPRATSSDEIAGLALPDM